MLNGFFQATSCIFLRSLKYQSIKTIVMKKISVFLIAAVFSASSVIALGTEPVKTNFMLSMLKRVNY